MPTITSEVRARIAGILAGEDHGGRTVDVGRLRSRTYRVSLDDDGYPLGDVHRTFEVRFRGAAPVYARNVRAGRAVDVQRWEVLIAYAIGVDEPSVTPTDGPPEQAHGRDAEEDAAADFAVAREALEDPHNWSGTTPAIVSIAVERIEYGERSDACGIARIALAVQVSYSPAQTWDAADTFDLSGTLVAVGGAVVPSAALAIVSGSGSDTSGSDGAWSIGVADRTTGLVRATLATYYDTQSAFVVQGGPVALGRMRMVLSSTVSSMYATLGLSVDAADGLVCVLFDTLDGSTIPSGCTATLSSSHDGAFVVVAGVPSFASSAATGDGALMFANVVAGSCTVTPSVPAGYVVGAAPHTTSTTVSAGKLTVHRFVVRSE